MWGIELTRRLYWRTLKPKRAGVKCMVVWQDQVLLIKNSYGSRLWNLPGGGVRKREALEEAAKRELREEVGINSPKLRLLGEYTSDLEGKKDTVYCYICNPENRPKLKLSREIEIAKWFKKDNLPKGISLSVCKTLEMLSLRE